jgi:serine/threonine protein kinase
MQQPDPLFGKQVGAYLIQSMLGEGGMARVYKAYHSRLRREVALKVIASEIAGQPDFQVRFEREAQLIASLDHPNIVSVYDFGEDARLHITYLVMQYVGGGTLRHQLRGDHPLELRRAVHYCKLMAEALHHAHRRGIVHRDVKPQNMLISASDPSQLLLSDFGIAKLFGHKQEATALAPAHIDSQLTFSSNPSLTSIDQIIGTAEYMAPEQINRQPLDARTDVYALGAVLYQMLTGRVPFQSSTSVGLLYQHVHNKPRSVREINPHIPQTLADITAKALEKVPMHRFQSAEAMAKALDTALSPTAYHISTQDPATFFGPSAPLPPVLQGRPPLTDTVSAPPPFNQPPRSVPVVNREPFTPTMITSGKGTGAIKGTRPKNAFRISSLGIAAMIILVAIILAVRFLPSFGSSGAATPSEVYTASFEENFHNNQRNWSGSTGGMIAYVQNNQYEVKVSENNTYFPHPAPTGTAKGPLPDSFTLTATMLFTGSNTRAMYGLAFRLSEQGSSVNSYAFIINEQGQYGILKYKESTLNNLRTGTSSLIKKGEENTLQVTVRHSQFSFKINGQDLSINGLREKKQSITDTDNPYTGGQLAVFLSGPDSGLVVKTIRFDPLIS